MAVILYEGFSSLQVELLMSHVLVRTGEFTDGSILNGGPFGNLKYSASYLVTDVGLIGIGCRTLFGDKESRLSLVLCRLTSSHLDGGLLGLKVIEPPWSVTAV
jgi:hypothetical protein